VNDNFTDSRCRAVATTEVAQATVLDMLFNLCLPKVQFIKIFSNLPLTIKMLFRYISIYQKSKFMNLINLVVHLNDLYFCKVL
jgi:hypothetical protein